MRSGDPGLPPSLALGVLVATAVVSPWFIGAVQPLAILTITAVGLITAAVCLSAGALTGGLDRSALPLWPLLGFLALGLVQLVPLPAAIHALVAPGSNAVWHPPPAAAAAILGAGPHPVSLDPDTTLRSVALVAALGLLAWLAAPALSRGSAAVPAVAVVAAGGFCLSAYAIFARARFGPLLYGKLAVPTVSPFGPFVSKNHFAGYVAMAALLAAGLALGLVEGARGRGRDWTTGPGAGGVVVAVVTALAMALAALASLSRGGGIALAAGALALIGLVFARARGRGNRAGLWSSLAVAGGLGVLLLALVPPEAHERMRSLRGASFRLDTWRDSLRMAGTSPLVGHGLGAFHDAYPRFKRGHGLIRVEHAENDYVETLAETGLVGLGLALFGAALVLTGAGRAGPGADRVVRGIGLGATAGLVALAVHSAVDFNLRLPSNAALAAVLVSAAAGAGGVRSGRLPGRVGLLLSVGAIALLAAVVSLPGENWVDAREEAGLSHVAQTPEARTLRLERSEAVLIEVLRRRPAHAESWLMLAGTHAARGDAASGAALARHAASLDPERPSLREAAERLAPREDKGEP